MSIIFFTVSGSSALNPTRPIPLSIFTWTIAFLPVFTAASDMLAAISGANTVCVMEYLISSSARSGSASLNISMGHSTPESLS